MNDQNAIGIDLGGTNFRLGVVSHTGEISQRFVSEVGKKKTPDDIVKLLTKHVTEIKNKTPNLKGIGVGIPGIVDAETGVVHSSPHYPEWSNVKFKELFEGAFGMPVSLDNDANMVALGEGWLGAGKDMKNFVLLTLGTGIGGGIYCDGKIWHGDHGFAGEVGHILIDFNGPHCNCGSRGCLEMYASATGLKKLIEDSGDKNKERFLELVGDNLEKVTPAFLYDRAKEGDIFASVIWKKFGSYLGAGLASIVNTLGITNIIIGGGVSRAWDFFIRDTEKEFKRRIYKRTSSLVKIHKTALGDDAGIIGAARVVLKTN